eukprot:1147649-Pelagomonas_calceolata.AAC.3
MDKTGNSGITSLNIVLASPKDALTWLRSCSSSTALKIDKLVLGAGAAFAAGAALAGLEALAALGAVRIDLLPPVQCNVVMMIMQHFKLL